MRPASTRPPVQHGARHLAVDPERTIAPVDAAQRMLPTDSYRPAGPPLIDPLPNARRLPVPRLAAGPLPLASGQPPPRPLHNS